jgi:hypothetical protein
MLQTVEVTIFEIRPVQAALEGTSKKSIILSPQVKSIAACIDKTYSSPPQDSIYFTENLRNIFFHEML